MSLRFHTKLKACDKCTDAIRQYHRDKQNIDYKQTIACPKCGAMYSRVRVESRINRSYCKYNAMLAKSKATRSTTYRRDDGSCETIHYGYDERSSADAIFSSNALVSYSTTCFTFIF